MLNHGDSGPITAPSLPEPGSAFYSSLGLLAELCVCLCLCVCVCVCKWVSMCVMYECVLYMNVCVVYECVLCMSMCVCFVYECI